MAGNEAARDRQAVTATYPFPLAQGGRGLAVYVPLWPPDGFAGVISAAFRAQALFDTLLAGLAPAYDLTVVVGDQGLYRWAPGGGAAPAPCPHIHVVPRHGAVLEETRP